MYVNRCERNIFASGRAQGVSQVDWASVLITGGSGFLGRGLVAELLRRDATRICVYSRDEAKHAAMRMAFGVDERLRYFIGDVRDADRLERACRGCARVIHAAALKRVETGESNPDEMCRTNIDGTRNVIDACLASGVAQLTLVSTDKAVSPVNLYGATKMAAERMVLGAPAPLCTAVVRYGNVAGSTGSVIPTWRADPARAVMTDPECTRYWMTLDEAVRFVLDARPRADVQTPMLPAYRLGDLAEAMGIAPRVVGLGASEKLHETMDGVSDSSKARRMTVQELVEGLRNV